VTVKRVIVLVAIAVVAALTVTVFVLRAQEESVTAGMVAQADRLDIPSDWELLEEVIRPEQTLCLSTNPCPSMNRNWQTDKELTAADLRRIVQPSGVALSIEGNCVRASNAIGNTGVCTATAVYGDYDLQLGVTSFGVGENSVLSLSLRSVQ
jgi:hypothetical protein